MEAKFEEEEKKTHQISLFYESKSKWNFKKFGRKDNQDNLHSGDVIWLHHLEFELSLTCQRSSSDYQNNFDGYEVKYKETESFRSNYMKYGGSIQGLWFVESSFKKGMNEIKNSFNNSIKLKHLESAMYLSTTENMKSLCLKQTPDDSCEFYFMPVDTSGLESTVLPINCIVRLISKKNKYQIRAVII